jgi:hypothetical protein
MSTTTELAAVKDGFEKAEKQDFGDDTSKIKFFWDSGGEEGGLDIGEVERSRRYHPWRSIAEGQDDVIWMGLEIKDEFCTFTEAWDALGRPEKFLLNSGNGSLFITLNREEPEDDLCPFCEAGGIRSPADSDAPWVCVDVGNTELLYGWLCRSCMDAGIDLG